jgi:membrane protein
MFSSMTQFLHQGVWETDLRTLKGIQRFGVIILRLVLVAAWEFRESVLSIRATSLVYTTLLSLVPFLAVMFSVLKAFGIHHQIEPVLAQALDPLGPKGIEITQNVIGFVDNLKVGVLGAVGVAGLFYTTYTLIDKIEEALNAIWRVHQGRPFARKFTDYLSVVLVGPVLVFTAIGDRKSVV